MPITTECPHCGKSVRAADTAAGKRVKCPKCQELFRVTAAPPEDDEDDAPEEKPAKRTSADEGEPERPRRKKGGNKKSGGSFVLPFAIGGGVLALLLVAIAAAGVWWATRGNGPNSSSVPTHLAQRPPGEQPPGGQVPPRGDTPPVGSVPPGQQVPPGGVVPPDGATWQTKQGKEEGLKFSLRLPPGWKWEEDVHMAGKQTSLECTIYLQVNISKTFVPKKDEPSDAYAKHTLELLAGPLGKQKEVTIQDQRVVKVGDLDAAWLAFTVQPEGQATPVALKTYCVMQTARYSIRIEGHRDDIRSRRTAKDFEESQAEFLKISQTFQVASQPPK